jgi:hypothetical protein
MYICDYIGISLCTSTYLRLILGRKPDKSDKSFPPYINAALRFLFLQTHATSYTLCKGERRKN